MRIKFQSQTIIPTFTYHILTIHFQSQHMTDIKTSVLIVAGKPAMVSLDYLISTGDETRYELVKVHKNKLQSSLN